MSFLELDRLSKTVRRAHRGRSTVARRRQGRVRLAARPVGLRQDHDAADDRGLRRPDVAARSARGPRPHWRCKPAKRGLGIVFQSYALFPHMTAAENVAFGLEMQGVAAGRARRRASGETLALVGLAAFAGPLSRAACRAASSSAWRSPARSSSSRSILLLDEPLSNLDAKLREEMQIELRQIQRTLGTTTILVTHDQAEAMALVRPHRGDEPGPRRADRPAARGLRAAGHAVRRELPRQDQRLAATSTAPSRRALAAGCRSAPATVSSGRRRSRSPAPARRRRLAATIKTRIFQGNHWLYQVETPTGLGDRDPPEQRRGRCRPRARRCGSPGAPEDMSLRGAGRRRMSAAVDMRRDAADGGHARCARPTC